MFNWIRLHSEKSTHWYNIAILLLAIGVFLVGLHQAPVPTIDGAVRASEARNIVETGQWFPITYQGKEVADHPPLFIWVTAISFKIFGVNDFAANLPQRLAAALVVILTALIAIEAGFSRAIALTAAIILCTSRDFVLSSVRGYIEPLLSLWIYLAVWLVFQQRNRKSLWSAFLAGVSIWLAVFSKGPPAIWPLLATAIFLLWKGGLPGYRKRVFGSFCSALLVMTLAWTAWAQSTQTWEYWRFYWDNQIVSSAVGGRGGAQDYDPLYFVMILLKYYWPWLPLLVWGAVRSVRWFWSLHLFDEAIYSWLFGIFGLGFVVGFSLVKWKFWYYIAPAYPAFALFIALTFSRFFSKIFENEWVVKSIGTLAFLWLVVGAVYPLKLYRERVQEVIDFKSTILGSRVGKNTDNKSPIWFLHSKRDHNQIATSGDWYFKRPVVKVTEEERWQATELEPQSWIITSVEYWISCQNRVVWCSKGELIQQSGDSALVWYR